MKTIGIITIHKICNYGSVLQAYALQQVCMQMGYHAELIDYVFPNAYQIGNKYQAHGDSQSNEPKWIKSIFGLQLMRQHKGIEKFVAQYLHLSNEQYTSPDDLKNNPPQYDIYLTGSDQVWNPRYTNGDPSFLLNFVPTGKKRIAYGASFGTNTIPTELHQQYKDLLGKYNDIAVRESSGGDIIYDLIGKRVQTVLDPTLLLGRDDWNKIATPGRLVKRPYILCYFLNYSFNAFPFVDELADEIQKQTGYTIVRVARPPHKLHLKDTQYYIEATPQDFLALMRDAELVLTTSFHGTAFAVNYGKPVFTIVKDKETGDSRQLNLMNSLGLEKMVLTIKKQHPKFDIAIYNQQEEQQRLAELRNSSLKYLKKALEDD